MSSESNRFVFPDPGDPTISIAKDLIGSGGLGINGKSDKSSMSHGALGIFESSFCIIFIYYLNIILI